jgi:hypothetical protein
MFNRNLSKDWSRVLLVAFSVTVLCVMLSGTASAQLSDKKTLVTFGAPVEIPGAGAQVLPAGSYIIKLVDSKVDRNIVQILNRDESHVYATILAIPNLRLKATDKTVMTFEERAAGQPPALRAWFYPGEKWGQEFVYPKTKATQLAKTTNLPIPYVPDVVLPNVPAAPAPTVQQEIAALEKAPLREVQPSGQNVAVSEVIQAPPVRTAALQPEGAVRNATLPKTAGNVPLFALIGLIFLAVGVSIKALCVR